VRLERASTRRRYLAVHGVLVAALLLQASIWMPRPTSAATTPSTTIGTGTPSSCSEFALSAALRVGGTIAFSCGANPVTITVTGQKAIAVDASIDGGGLITLSGANTTSIFSVKAGVTLTLANVTVSNANSRSVGGAIANAGTLVIRNSVFSNNVANNSGGAIYSSSGASLTVSGSTFSNNSAGNSGGALYHGHGYYDNDRDYDNNYDNDEDYERNKKNSGLLNIQGSTFSGNTAAHNGGAIYNNAAGTLTVSNSTLSGNAAGTLASSNRTSSGNTATGNRSNGNGGALANVQGATVLNNVTVAGNTARNGKGGGIAVSGGTVSLANTILSGNAAASSPECSGSLSSQGYNLIFNTSGCTVATTNNVIGADSGLGPLQNNGGPTQTMALTLASPAVGAGNPATPDGVGSHCMPVDQRGVQRPAGACDIGAFQVARGPAVSPPADQTATEATSAAIDLGSFTDPGAAAGPWTVDVDWGDGSSHTTFTVQTTGSLGSQNHTYGAVPGPKTYAVTVTVTNATKLAGSATFHVAVTPELNDAWTKARRLTPTASAPQDPSNLTAQASQYVYLPGQSKWYKFRIQPGSKAVVSLTNLPANYDLVLYRDVAAAYASLASPQDLAHINAELPYDAFSGDAFSGDAFSGDAFSGDAFSGDAFSGDAFSPDAVTGLGTFDAQNFASAQTRSLIAVSALGGTADETIVANTWENAGDFYVRVRGRNGTSSLAAPFQLEVTLLTGVCASVAPVSTPSSLPASGPGLKTVVLTDYTRLPGSSADVANLKTSLSEFVSRPEVTGVVVDVSRDAAVAAANKQSDQHASCPTAKNYSGQTIKAIVDKYRAANPGLQYVVIVGGDNVIPFFREPDQSSLASEKNYFPPVLDASASQASLRNGYVLSQDRYVASTEISFKSTTLPIPGLAVGRLVETASEATGMLSAYLATANGVVQPTSSLVTGYDFLADSAQAIKDQLQAGTGAVPDSLIQASGLPPTDPSAWTASDLSAQLLGERHDLTFLAGHFSQGSALAADYATQLLASDVAASDVDLTNAIVVSVGCHSGYNTVDAEAVTGLTRQPDWAQALARKRATLIGGTGYQYGDTDFLKYSESLYLELFKQLRTGTGSVPIGSALVQAKRSYLANTARIRGIDTKVLLESTLFGLPMLGVDMPGQRLSAPTDPSLVSSTTPYRTGPGASLGLARADLSVAPQLTTHTVQLTNVSTGAIVTATYLAGGNGVVTNTFEPVLPLEVRNVTVANTVLRGVGFRGGSYTDHSGVLPLVSATATELSTVHLPFFSNALYPVQPWTTNYFDALANGATRLQVTPAQFRSASPGSQTGTLRAFSSMNFRLFYSNNLTPAALSAAPDVWRVAAVPGSGSVQFNVNVQGNPAAGVQEVWVTYTCAAAGYPCSNTWLPFDLAQDGADPTLWTGTLQLPVGVAASAVRFVAQAANGVGLVTLATNFGATYVPGATTATGTPTSLALTAAPASGAYGTKASFSATLKSNGSPVANQPLVFAIGSQRQVAITDSTGTARASLTLLVAPDPYQLRVSFAGNAAYQPSSAEAPFAVTKQATQLSVSPTSTTVQRGAATPILATLTDSAGQPLDQRTVIFVVNPTGSRFIASAITDYLGRAPLGAVPLPSGTYGVSVCFGGGTIAVGGQSVTLTDPLYESSPQGGCSAPQAGGSITLTAADTTTTVSSSANPSVIGQAVTFTATVSAGAAPLGVPTGSVTFFDGTTALGTGALNAAGQGTVTTSSLSAGSHAITAVYAGDPNFRPSTSTVLTQEVTTQPSKFTFTGFFPPVDNPPALNVVRAGSAVPVKFSLGGNRGLDIFAPGSPSLELLASCPSGAPLNTVSKRVDTTTGHLAFDAETNRYVYVWKTDRRWSGQCGTLRVTLSDGSEHTALFRFKQKPHDQPD
jgi:predicted outer membrane repeat protein